MKLKRYTRGPALWVILALVLVFALSSAFRGDGGYSKASTGTVLSKIQAGEVVSSAKVNKILDREQVVKIQLKASDGTPGKKLQASFLFDQGRDFAAAFEKQKIDYDVTVSKDNVFVSLLLNFLPFLIILGLLFFFMNQMQGGGSRVMQFGKSKAKLVSKDTPKTTFADVAGADEAIEELHEIKEFLENPGKFQAIGAKIPKGVLLYGPPGTGKTLLARAVAGEAGVPFYSISGSDFVEMFVGVGASRVRDLFTQAKENSPSIIFVDEIDAVGRHRGAGIGGGNDEREQTLNQLLVEMDGFDVKTNVILIAATNRPDVLDPALLRPGRFDRQIPVEAPDLVGRPLAHGGAQVVVQLGPLHPHVTAQRSVEIGQWFVQQEHFGLAHDGAADGDALALAAGKRCRLALQQMFHLQDAGRFAYLGVADRFGGLGQLQAKADIVVHRHMRIERIGLEHHGDAAVAWLHIVAQLAADPQLAARNVLKPGDHPQQGGLAAARGADKDDEFAMLDLEVDAFDDVDTAKALVQIFEFKIGHGGSRNVRVKSWRRARPCRSAHASGLRHRC